MKYTEREKNQEKGRSIVPFTGRSEAKKNLKRRHLRLHGGSRLETMIVWHNVQLRTDTKPSKSGQSFHCFQETLKSPGLHCPSSDTSQTLRSFCLPQYCSRKPDFHAKLVLLTLPPWCRSSWPACPPCSRPWRKQPGSARRTQPGVEQKDRVLLKGSRDINTQIQTQNCLRLEWAFPSFSFFFLLFFFFFFFSIRQWRDPVTADLPWRDCRSIYSSHTWGVQVYRIRLIAVISTEGIKNEQAEKCIQEWIIIIIKRGKVIWIQIPSFHLETSIYNYV